MKKFQAQIIEANVKPLYYYKEKNTICLLIQDGQCVARGVSICSPLDQFVKRTGRAMALGRAMQALKHRTHNGLIEESRRVHYHLGLLDALVRFGHKSIYMPVLTEFEFKLINVVAKGIDAGH